MTENEWRSKGDSTGQKNATKLLLYSATPETVI